MVGPETVEETFAGAVEIGDPQERAAFVAQQCGADQELRQRVERLLRAHDGAGHFLETPAALLEQPDAALLERPGSVIDCYKLLEKIGEGGMAVVFMAEQTAPIRRQVALKVIKPGMDTAQIIARFQAERQALALMDHPNIARVLDAGATETGRPYFVMELVRGIPITEYCDKNNLSTEERLGLFSQVCLAVQHAHLKGIIHRDLKPTNVLVTLHDGTPVPKVIDFGIAKAMDRPLTDRTLFTAFRQFVGTPQYMSPEQAEMSALGVDTRSDIYSLGVLLYELLTGTTPLEEKVLRTAAYDEMCRLIREVDPPPPSTRLSTMGNRATEVARRRGAEPAGLGKLLRGDLDWIVIKALEKDRTRRYQTATDLAADVQRHLSDQPVVAGPPGVGYRMRKFVRRHRTGVFTASLLVASLIIGLAATTAGLVRASRERAKADRAAVSALEAKGEADVQRARAEARQQEAETERTRAEEQRRRAEGVLARSQLDRGVELVSQGDARGLLDLLDARITAEEIPELRDSAGRLWAVAHSFWADRLVHVLKNKTVVAFSPDGRLLATHETVVANLWDLVTGDWRQGNCI